LHQLEGGPIESVSEFVQRLTAAPVSGRRLFRGQKADQRLLPKIVTLAEKKGIAFDGLEAIERKMIERFRRESMPMRESLGDEADWEILSIAQHHGMPTRLLDWTANALAGLWFAVSRDSPGECAPGVVWVLEVDPKSEKVPTRQQDILRLGRTYVFQPPHLDRRIAAQSAWFTLHRYQKEKDQFTPLDKNRKYRSLLTRYTVQRELFQPLRQELRLLGITSASMFPDLVGLCADIEAEFIRYR
jgi:hypothetical protein